MKEKKETSYIGYEYKEVTVSDEQVSMYIDCYACFGWESDGNIGLTQGRGCTTIRMKRDRKIVNKVELTRLQQHFEACMNEIEVLEGKKTSTAMIQALTVGIIGTVFMAGATFAAVHEPPVIWLCILLAIPAFIGWFLPYYIYRQAVQKKSQKIQSMIEAKREEIHKICEKGHSLL